MSNTDLQAAFAAVDSLVSAKKATAKKKAKTKKTGSIPGARLKKKTSTASKQAKTKKRSKTRASVVSASSGHHFFDGKNYYVDTAFINSLSRFWPEAYRGLSHMGFGEFVAKLPDGTEIEFDKMRGKDFPGQSGRSHQVYDNKNGKGVEKMIQLAEQKGASELVSAAAVSAGAPRVTPKQFKGYVKAQREGISFNDNYNKDKFGITMGVYNVIRMCLESMAGTSSPRGASLKQINDFLAGDKVQLARAHPDLLKKAEQVLSGAAMPAKAAVKASLRSLRFISDPGHGWLEVPVSELKALGIDKKISHYSYQKGDMAYLEEDMDAGIYLDALKKAGLSEPKIEEVYQRNTPIRHYRSFSASVTKAQSFTTRPNLRALNKLIVRGLISAEEVVLAIEEALVYKRMNRRLAALIADKLREVFGVGEVLDLGDVPLAAGAKTKAKAVRAGGGKIVFFEDGFREVFGGGVYDTNIIDHRNPKAVQKAAIYALNKLKGKPNLTYSEVIDFVNETVAKMSQGKWTYVRWNSKSYPD